MKSVMETYKRTNLAPVRGHGSWLLDERGERYLDFVAGIATNSLGHGHPALVGAIKDQAEKLVHCSNLYEVPLQAEVAGMLTSSTDFDRVFFCNSGAEAVEAAIKLARKHAQESGGPEKHEILTFTKSFHGRTYGGLTATAQTNYHQGFGPMLPGFAYAPFGDLEAAREMVGPNTAAILVEPIQGEGGVNPASMEFLQAARRLCDERGMLLMLDEVQTGFARTGRWFGFQHYGIQPDVVCLAKALGNGMPIGAMWARADVAAAFQPGDHGSTYSGQPMATSAARKVLEIMERDGLPARAEEMGAVLRAKLEGLPQVTSVRGAGLILAAEIGPLDSKAVYGAALERGLVVNAITPTALRLTPPLTVSAAEIDEAVAILAEVLAGARVPETV